MLIIDILISCFAAILALFCSYKIFQIFQLSSYRVKPVIAWLKNTGYDYLIRHFSLGFLSFVGMLVFITCFSAYEGVVYIGLLFYVVFSVIFASITFKEQKKTPLKFTPRIIRTAVLFAVLLAGLAFGLLKLGELLTIGYSLVAAVLFLIPFVCALSFIILSPFERLNNRRFLKKAKTKLGSIDGLIKIGITGSFGKTTAKNILAKMLEKKYKVASSPKSYNTPMGLCKYINCDMPTDSNVLIAEMGARNVGDIKELTDFIEPKFALLTSVGNQHLDTFATLENIVNTKFELIEGLPSDGVAVFNGESNEVLGMFDRCGATKYLANSVNDEVKANSYYSNLVVSGEGTSFDLTIGDKTVSVNTSLLGKHVAGLICACAQMASVLGVEIADIAMACKELKPVEHRLQFIKNGDTVVLDDSYNSNLDGAKNALEVLTKLEGTKIIITPGFVELGQQESELNSALGGLIFNANVDYAYLVGSRAADIKSGAVAAGLNEERIFIFESLNAAVEKLKDIAGKKAVLFENDLPDNL